MHLKTYKMHMGGLFIVIELFMMKFNKSVLLAASVYVIAILVFAGCAKSVSSDLDAAVATHIKATTSAEAEDVCRKVFVKAQKNKTSSTELCEALSVRTDTEISICEDEIQASEFSALVVSCKAKLMTRIEKIKKDRNVGVDVNTNSIDFKLPFEVQTRDVTAGYTAVTGDTQTKQVILSFDDGPHPLSKAVVEILDRVGVKAHFMQVGIHVKMFPEITKLIASSGHSIGNHSWDHSEFTKLSFEDQVKQISDTNRIILETIGWIDPFFRYPYGATTAEMNQFLKDHSEANFLWSVDTNDWKKINADKSVRTNAQVIQETLDQLDQRGRGLVLFHDVHARTIELLPTFLKRLYEKGYTVVLLQASNSNLRNSPHLP